MLHVAHSEEGCLLPWLGSVWRTQATMTVRHGLAKAGTESRPPRPAVSRENMTQIASTMGWADQLAMLAFISWSFLLRAPSGCLRLERQRAGEDIPTGERLEREAVIGLAERKLIAKLAKGQHMALGS